MSQLTEVLEVLDEAREPMTAHDIARITGLPVKRVHTALGRVKEILPVRQVRLPRPGLRPMIGWQIGESR